MKQPRLEHARRRLAGLAIASLAVLSLTGAAPQTTTHGAARGKGESAAPSRAPPRTPADDRPVDRVLIVSIDGLGPDLIRSNLTPNIRALMARGASTLSALTTRTVKTLPSHTSMLTGVTPEKHGIDWNDAFHGYPKFPTLMEVAKQRRPELTTALAAGKAKFKTFARAGTLDWSFVPAEGEANNETVAAQALGIIREHRPNVMMVHLADVDLAGHAYGWGSAQQGAAVASADKALGAIIAALREARVLDQTVLIVTADHGGVGRTHSLEDGSSIRIPWIIAGPGVRAGLDLATIPGLEVHVEDTFATASAWLGLPLDPRIDGHVVPVAVTRASPGGERWHEVPRRRKAGGGTSH